MLDLSAMQREIHEWQRGKGLDEVNSESYVRIMGKVREIFNTPDLFESIHIYQTTQRGAD